MGWRRSDLEDEPASSRTRRGILTAASLCLCALLIDSCAGSAVQPYLGEAARTETLYVIDGGWHTEIALGVDAISGPLRSLREARHGATFLVFGWGQRDYYMAKDPDLGDLLRAAIAGPAVMLVIPLAVTPAEAYGASQALAVHASPEGLAHLSQYLWDDLKKEPGEAAPRAIADGPYPGSAFYPSTRTYAITHTCNTWTAEALHTAGLPVNATGVVFADQVLEQLRHLGRTGGS